MSWANSRTGNVVIGLTGLFMVAAVAVGTVSRIGLNPLMTDKEGTVNQVKALHPHWKDVKATGYGWLSCENGPQNGDTWRTRYSAINEAGQPVRGVACEGIFSAPVLRVTN